MALRSRSEMSMRMRTGSATDSELGMKLRRARQRVGDGASAMADSSLSASSFAEGQPLATSGSSDVTLLRGARPRGAAAGPGAALAGASAAPVGSGDAGSQAELAPYSESKTESGLDVTEATDRIEQNCWAVIKSTVELQRNIFVHLRDAMDAECFDNVLQDVVRLAEDIRAARLVGGQLPSEREFASDGSEGSTPEVAGRHTNRHVEPPDNASVDLLYSVATGDGSGSVDTGDLPPAGQLSTRSQCLSSSLLAPCASPRAGAAELGSSSADTGSEAAAAPRRPTPTCGASVRRPEQDWPPGAAPAVPHAAAMGRGPAAAPLPPARTISLGQRDRRPSHSMVDALGPVPEEEGAAAPPHLMPVAPAPAAPAPPPSPRTGLRLVPMSIPAAGHAPPAPASARLGSSREVSFCMNCTGTRLGFHVRVVGACAALGNWHPEHGLVLVTSPTDFPVWKSMAPVTIEAWARVEYKYVICDSHASDVTWEQRPNRLLDLSDSAPQRPHVLVTETYAERDEKCRPCERFRSASEMGRSLEARMATPKVLESIPRGTCGWSVLGARCPSKLLTPREVIIPEDQPQDLRPGAATAAAGGAQGSRGEALRAHREAAPAPAPSDAMPMLVREESFSQVHARLEEAEEPDGGEFHSRYRLFGSGPLGEGAWGLVWRCTPRQGAAGGPAGEGELAAKIVRKAMLQPRDVTNLLGPAGEVVTHLALKHPHIVTLHEYFDEQHAVTLVLECCRGGDLFDAVNRECQRSGRGFAEPSTARAMEHILSALAYIHRNGVVHRDLKCENILLGMANLPPEENQFKLCDFGFATRDDGRHGLTDRVGSPFTVAPEVVAGKSYGSPVDAWSAGVVMYMTLAAKTPFYAPTNSEVLRRVLAGKYSLDGGIWDSVSPMAKGLMRSLMTLDPQLRKTAQQALRNEWFLLASSS